MLLTFLATSLYGACNLKLQLAWTYLFDDSDPVVVEFQKSRELFPYPGDIAVLVDQGTATEREAFMDLVATEMAKEPEVYHHIFYRLDLALVGKKALYYLDEELLKTMCTTLGGPGGVERDRLVSEPAVKIQLKLLEDLKNALLSRGRSTMLPIWREFTDERVSEVAQTLSKLLNGERFVYATIAQNKVHALVFKGGDRLETLKAPGQEVAEVRRLLDRLQPASYGLRVRLTGLPVMLYDERQTCSRDSIRSGFLSLGLILAVFILGFGGMQRPLFAISGLICGLGWTFAYAAATVGHLNFVTVTMVSMLMGLGIDFGIHFLFRFEEQRTKGEEPEAALASTVKSTGVDTFVGAAATSASFLALTATDFRGVSDLGILASGGVLLCFFSTITVLPALLALFPKLKNEKPPLYKHLQKLEQGLLEMHKLIAILTIVAIGAGLLLAMKVGFSYNLLDIQAQELTSVRTEREMLQDYDTTVLNGAVLVKGAEEARRVARRLKQLETVGKVSNLTDMLPVVNPDKCELVEKIVKASEELEVPTPVALDRARDLLMLRRRLEEIDRRSEGMPKNPDVVAAVDEVKAVVADMNPGPIQDGLRSFQRAILRDFAKLLGLLKSQEAEPLTLEDLPQALKIRYLSEDDTYLLSVQPGVDIWQRENLSQFLSEVDSVGVTLVGHPVVQNHILESFDRAFKVTPWYTLFGVFTVMLLYLRRPTQVLLGFLPTALGVVLIFAVMGGCGMQFNVVNFVALPISVGIGAVYGVHALNRMDELGDVALLSTSTGFAILLSGLTTIAGFASLITAQHRGLSSFGFVISVGVVANLLVSLVVLPAVRKCWLERSATKAD